MKWCSLKATISATTDFAPFINKIQAAAPDAVLGGGHFQDGSTFARQLYEKGVPLKFVSCWLPRQNQVRGIGRGRSA
jgi:ABC-type branched-subunit amino acid transport system substrate-binding protein